MKAGSPKDKRARASVLAGVLAAALLLTGTFAWRSMSQAAANEFVDARNPGGRVHDDFNGMKNKDVYVENFTDVEDGAPVFARVKLLEYMETGADAGKNRDDPDRKATSLVPGAYLNQPDTWQVYIPGRTDDKFREYWNWTMGGETTYLPTFNKNKDSLSADVNGTYVGPNGEFDDVDPYKDYQEYEAGTAYPGTEYYDADDNDDDEYIKDGVGGSLGNGGVLGTNYSIKADVEHVALKTLNGLGIISMADWKAQGSPICNKWVYDTDGWFYWPEPIQPQTATGLLLDKVDQRKSAGERSYYAIEVVGQFSNGAGGTEDDKWGDSSITDNTDPNKGFYADGFSEDAKALLDQAASVVIGKEDAKWYLPEPENNNLYKEIKDDAGTLSELISAGMNGIIGTADDRSDVMTHTADIVIAGKNYGKYYLPATEAEPFYRVNGNDGKLGTKTDTYFWLTSGSDFPSENVTTDPVTSITVTAADDAVQVKNDTTLAFTAAVETALDNKNVTWSVSGNKSAETVISDTGVLTVKGEDIDTELTVTATSKLDPRKSGSATVKVVGKIVDIAVSGESTVRAGSHLDMGVTVTVDGAAETTPAVTWAALDEAGSKISGVEIDANGKLTVAETVEVGTKIKVTAAYMVDGRQTVSAPVGVEVLEKNEVRVAPTLTSGVTTVEAGQKTVALSLTVTDKDDKVITPTTKTWSVATTAPTTREIDPETQVTISADGKLNIGSKVPARTGVTVTCEITYPDPENTGSTLTASGSASFTVAGPSGVVITTTEDTVPQTGELTMKAQLKKADKTTNYASNEVIWELSGATQAGTKIDPSTGVLTVAEEEPLETPLTVTVKAVVDETVTASKILTVVARGYNLTTDVNGTFSEANQTFRVLVKDEINHKALVIREQLLSEAGFGKDNVWRNSPIRTTLNGTYYNSLGNLKEFVQKTDIMTRATHNSSDFITTQDYVFLLSEADLFGTRKEGGTVEARDYTAGKQLFTSDSERIAKKAGSESSYWWSRSPHGTDGLVLVGPDGASCCFHYAAPYGVRPAFWIAIQ